MEIKQRRFLIILCSALFILLGLTGLFIYEYFRIKPNDVHFTNVTSSAVTVSWNTDKAIAGTVKVKESGSFLPFALFNRGSRFYDTRDVKNAEVLGVEATAENVAQDDDFVVSSGDFETDVEVTDMGEYYTHHVTVTGLDPQTEYSFMVGDTLLFRDVSDYDGNESVTTLEVPESVKSPYPAYGSVKDAGNENVPIDQLAVVDDGVVYVNYVDENTGERSNVFSGSLNSSGNWYVDLSLAVDGEGNDFLQTYQTPDENVYLEININTGLIGKWKTTQYLSLMTPVPVIVLNMPNSVQDINTFGSVVNIESPAIAVKGESVGEVKPTADIDPEYLCEGNGLGTWSGNRCNCVTHAVENNGVCNCLSGYVAENNTCVATTDPNPPTCVSCQPQCSEGFSEGDENDCPGGSTCEYETKKCDKTYNDGSGKCGERTIKCYKVVKSLDPNEPCVFDDYCGPCRAKYTDGSYGTKDSCDCSTIINKDTGEKVVVERMCSNYDEDGEVSAQENLTCADGSPVDTVIYYEGACKKCSLYTQNNYYQAKWVNVDDEYEYDGTKCVLVDASPPPEPPEKTYEQKVMECYNDGGEWNPDTETCDYPPGAYVPSSTHPCSRCSNDYKYAWSTWSAPAGISCEKSVSEHWDEVAALGGVTYSCNTSCTSGSKMNWPEASGGSQAFIDCANTKPPSENLAENCSSSGGQWIPSTSTCDCPPNQYPNEDGYCLDYDNLNLAGNCSSSGGQWIPSTSTCSCPFGQITDDQGRCTDDVSQIREHCIGTGGQWIQATNTCDCPGSQLPNSQGYCVDLTSLSEEDNCENSGGDWMSSTSTCDCPPNQYPNEDGYCRDIADLSFEDNCESSGGTWSSSGSCDCPGDKLPNSQSFCVDVSDGPTFDCNSGNIGAPCRTALELNYHGRVCSETNKCVKPDSDCTTSTAVGRWSQEGYCKPYSQTELCYQDSGIYNMYYFDGSNLFLCRNGLWEEITPYNPCKGPFSPCDKAGDYCQDKRTLTTYKCEYIASDGGYFWVDTASCPLGLVQAYEAKPINTKFKCDYEKCFCLDGADQDGFVNEGQYCREVRADQCSVAGGQPINNGKICSNDSEKHTCQDGRCKVSNDSTGSSQIIDDLWGKVVLSAIASTTEYIYDAKTGIFTDIPKGSYLFEYNGTYYAFDLSAYNIDPETGGVLIFIDENQNGIFDEGVDIKVSDIASSINIVALKQKFNYSLEEGLNFISMPYLISNSEWRTAASLLVKLNEVYNDSIYSISRFDGGQWKMVGENSQLYDNNDFQLLPGVGYIIKAKRDVDISIVGQPVQLETTDDSSPIYFSTGWNLIGLYGTNVKSYTAKTLIEDVNSGDITADNVTQWDKDMQRYDGLQITDGEEYGFDYPLNILESYFVRIIEGSGKWQPQISGNN